MQDLSKKTNKTKKNKIKSQIKIYKIYKKKKGSIKTYDKTKFNFSKNKIKKSLNVSIVLCLILNVSY